MSAVVQVAHLEKRFGQTEVLKDINFEVQAGEIVGLLGVNGAGKSTSLKILTTVIDASAGELTIAGLDVRREPAKVRKIIGFVPQLLSADGSLTAFENLMLAARIYNIPRPLRQQAIEDSLRLVELSPHTHHLVKTFSGGMVRRLELAQALIHSPPLVLLDEPTVGLDLQSKRTLWQRLLDLKTKDQLAVLITTHDMHEAEVLCDRIAILHEGRIAAFDTPQALRDAHSPQASLEDVMLHFSQSSDAQGQRFESTQQTRSNAKRFS